jgi:alpha-mannosidase
LSNGVQSATVDAMGRVTSLRTTTAGGASVEVVPADGSINNLVLYDDNPKYWEAWDIDEDYLNHAHPVSGKADSLRVVEQGPLVPPLRYRARSEREAGSCSDSRLKQVHRAWMFGQPSIGTRAASCCGCYSQRG